MVGVFPGAMACRTLSLVVVAAGEGEKGATKTRDVCSCNEKFLCGKNPNRIFLPLRTSTHNVFLEEKISPNWKHLSNECAHVVSNEM